ncbi:hypothetical protein CDAR_23821 [Caerostris darwini]|uniref:NADH dehydrogenase subunit 4 n=1 Tax=Caerostris darwini TaxID=1538125 RepID=A0AAV4RCU2_9ARAC|nr:hypothetical protein CDAR_23821 [Caerostris darwini]
MYLLNLDIHFIVLLLVSEILFHPLTFCLGDLLSFIYILHLGSSSMYLLNLDIHFIVYFLYLRSLSSTHILLKRSPVIHLYPAFGIFPMYLLNLDIHSSFYFCII